MVSLYVKFMLLLGVLGGIVFTIVALVGQSLGVNNFYFYLLIALAIMIFQYLLGPTFVELTTQIQYVTKKDYPNLVRMVEELAHRANVPVPRVGISRMPVPNAFAFGRSLRDGRICVTEGIMKLLNDNELKAVLAHEMTHLKNRDVFFMSILSVIPMLISVISNALFYSQFSRRRDEEDRGGNIFVLRMVLMLLGFITSLLLMYGSRIREYFADKGAVDLGNKPSDLASALYKLVYGSARIDQQELVSVQGVKAFFVNDPSRALEEFRELKVLDQNRDGDISASELFSLRNKRVKLDWGSKIMELLQTHPNMLKRIKQLSQYE